jgi:hypothetical protein
VSPELFDAIDRQLSWPLVRNWLDHPVTRVVGVVVAAEIAHQLVLHYGIKLLGLAEETPSA